MSSREKTLAVIVAVTVVGLLGYQAVSALVIKPRQRLVQHIGPMPAERDKLLARAQARAAAEAQWRNLTGRTLGASEYEAQLAFREDLMNLLRDAGFENPEVKRPNSQPRLPYKDAGFTEVALPVQVKGNMGNLAAFLRQFYQRPYFAGFQRVTITEERTGSATGRGRAAGPPPEPTLDINFIATALVLPRVLKIEPTEYVGHDAPPDPPRLARAELAEYDALAGQNMFKVWAPAVAQPTPPRPRDEPPPDPGPPAVVAPPRPDKTLVGVESLGGHYFAHVRDNTRLDLPPEEFTLHAPVDDGTLVLVHPRGIVVRVEQEGGESVDYFYALGSTFQERTPLDPGQHPDVFAALQQHAAL